MNESKPDLKTHAYLAAKSETDTEGRLHHGNKELRRSKTPGSLLCNAADIQSHCRLAVGNIAFHSLWKLWHCRTQIPLRPACVSIMPVYPTWCTTVKSWSATKQALCDSVPATETTYKWYHRTQLAEQSHLQPDSLQKVHMLCHGQLPTGHCTPGTTDRNDARSPTPKCTIDQWRDIAQRALLG